MLLWTLIWHVWIHIWDCNYINDLGFFWLYDFFSHWFGILMIRTRNRQHMWVFTTFQGLNKKKHRKHCSVGVYIDTHGNIAGFLSIKHRRSIVRLRSRHFQPNKNRQNMERGRQIRHVANERAQTTGGKTVRWEGRRLDKQTTNNNNRSEGFDAKGSRRCGSVAKETRGRNGRKAKE